MNLNRGCHYSKSKNPLFTLLLIPITIVITLVFTIDKDNRKVQKVVEGESFLLIRSSKEQEIRLHELMRRKTETFTRNMLRRREIPFSEANRDKYGGDKEVIMVRSKSAEVP